MLEHEWQTVAMELAAALHHSHDAGPGTYAGLRTQKTATSGQRPGVLTEPEPQGGAVTVGHVAAHVPFLSSPMLTDAAAETVDARTVKYPLKAALRRKEGEERKEWEMELARRNEQQWRVTEASEKTRAALQPSRGSKRKRKKRRKRRLLRSSVPRGGRARRRQREWLAPGWVFLVLCRSRWHLRHHGRHVPEGLLRFWLVVLYSLFWSSGPRFVIRAGMDQKDSHVVCLHGRQYPCRGAKAFSYGPGCSADHRDSPIALVQDGRCPWYAGRGGYFSPCGGAEASHGPLCSWTWWLMHSCRDTEADPHGLADHRDSPVCLR